MHERTECSSVMANKKYVKISAKEGAWHNRRK